MLMLTHMCTRQKTYCWSRAYDRYISIDIKNINKQISSERIKINHKTVYLLTYRCMRDVCMYGLSCKIKLYSYFLRYGCVAKVIERMRE